MQKNGKWKIRQTFHPRFGAEKLLLRPETGVKSNCGGEKFGGFSLAVLQLISY